MTTKVSAPNPKPLNPKLDPKLYFPSPIKLSEALDTVRDNQYALALTLMVKGLGFRV